MTPGVHHGLSNADYQAVEAVGSTALKRLARSPEHCFKLTIDPRRPGSESTPAMRAGNLCHAVVLEPDAVAERYIVKPADLDLRTKAGKSWAEAMPSNVEIVSAEQMEVAHAQAASLRRLPEIEALLGAGHAETSAFAIDKETDLLTKARPDWTYPTGNDDVVLLDLKTCVDASPAGFARATVTYGYALQHAHYVATYEAASGESVLAFTFICVESTYPFVSAAYVLSDAWVEFAQRERRRLLDLYASCKASGVWPGYSSTVEMLEPPRWLQRDVEAAYS